MLTEKIALANFLKKPEEVLGLIELCAGKDAIDNAPISYSIALGAGESVLYTITSIEGWIGINTSFWFEVDTAGVLDYTVYFDGRPYLSTTSVRAVTTGGFLVPFFGYVPCNVLQIQAKNNGAGVVNTFIISYGAWIRKQYWEKLSKVLKSFGQQLIEEGKVG